MSTTAAEVRALRAGHALEEEFNAIALSLGGDLAGRARGDAYLATTHALYHGGPLTWALTPKVYTPVGVDFITRAAETMGAIMAKVTRAFASDASVRAAFHLDPVVEELARIDCGYDCPIPIARVDIFLDERSADFWFCETNTDGSAGMTSAVEVSRAIQRTPTYGAFARLHPRISTFDVLGACGEAILATYAEWTGPKAADVPTIGVVDYGESISADEVDDFIERFAAQGVACRFSEIRDLRIEGGRLSDATGPIDVVWRRAVLSEMLDKPCAGADGLVRAQREGLACVVGGFRTWPAATKTFFSALRDPAVARLLDASERAYVEAHVPYTEVLGPGSDLERFEDKDRWIVKPAGGYNAMGVVAGLDESSLAWREVLTRARDGGSVIQRYAPQFDAPIILGGALPYGDDELTVTRAHMMEGLFLFRGRFGGVFTRAGSKATIGEWTERVNMGALVVDDGEGEGQ